MMTERIFRYVTHSQRSAYEVVGWVFSSDLGPPHCMYSVLMEWPHEREPENPDFVSIGDAANSVLSRLREVAK